MYATDSLTQGREAFTRRAWADAYAQLAAADRETPLGEEDLERLAVAADLLGRDDDSAEVWARLHQAYLKSERPERAARAAFWVVHSLADRGEPARAAGWMARARRLLDDGQRDCVERGYLMILAGIKCFTEGDCDEARAVFADATGVGDRFGDRDLVALGLHGQGRVLIRMGERDQGIGLLDEVMVAVTESEISPVVAGDVYCGMISACYEVFDLRRAQEWTAALGRWCAAQPELVAYRGQCLIRRAEIMQVHGAWSDAMAEAERACERLSQPAPRPGLGAAFYQLAELHRVRGEFEEAAEAYRRAGEAGRDPQPGLALLRLAQGRVEAAVEAIRHALVQSREVRLRSRLLPAAVEIFLAGRDLDAARAAGQELDGIAGDLGAPLLAAAAAHASGAVLVAGGDARAALEPLRRAAALWRELDAPYERARAGLLLAVAAREQGDRDGERTELEAARETFRRLGAVADLHRLERLSRPPRQAGGQGLTKREVEVIGLIATGKTNRGIAGELGISEKTVARHVSNIFTKLGLSSRAAATAYAYQNDLV